MENVFEKNNNNQLEDKVEEKVEEVANELQVNLPKVNMPITLKLIALFTLIGGLSIIGSLFSDIVRPTQDSFGSYILRIIVGVLSIVIAWAILEKRKIAIWLYGLIVLVGLFTNPIVALLPTSVLIYLYINRNAFTPSIFDQGVTQAKMIFKKLLKGHELIK